MKTEEVFSLLSGHKLCLAESFTGGGVAREFVALAGASKFLVTGLVCYSEEAKEKLLGVKEQTIRTFGAVSKETVSEMLDGLRALGLGDVYAATSGNAGPSAEREGDVGLFYVGAMAQDKKVIREFRICGTRSEVIAAGIRECIDLIAFVTQK